MAHVVLDIEMSLRAMKAALEGLGGLGIPLGIIFVVLVVIDGCWWVIWNECMLRRLAIRIVVPRVGHVEKSDEVRDAKSARRRRQPIVPSSKLGFTIIFIFFPIITHFQTPIIPTQAAVLLLSQSPPPPSLPLILAVLPSLLLLFSPPPPRPSLPLSVSPPSRLLPFVVATQHTSTRAPRGQHVSWHSLCLSLDMAHSEHHQDLCTSGRFLCYCALRCPTTAPFAVARQPLPIASY